MSKIEELEEIKGKNRTVYCLAGMLTCIDASKANGEILADYVRECASIMQRLSGELMEFLDNMAE